jgi:hypothetical protein
MRGLAFLFTIGLLLTTGCSDVEADSGRAAASSDPAPSDTAWVTLFDGSNLDQWRGFQRDDVPSGWRIEEGTLAFVPGTEGGDLITREQYDDFELELEWRISEGGNSGIFYRVSEDAEYSRTYQTGPEFQVLDNDGHSDGVTEAHRAGANYALHAPSRDVTRPVGEWNTVRIVADSAHVEHWLNGEKIVEYEQWSDEWQRLVDESKFIDMPGYGQYHRGHIALQDHGDRVWYRNVRIRPLR